MKLINLMLNISSLVKCYSLIQLKFFLDSNFEFKLYFVNSINETKFIQRNTSSENLSEDKLFDKTLIKIIIIITIRI